MKNIEQFLNKYLYKIVTILLLLIISTIYIYNIDYLPSNVDESFNVNVMHLSTLSEAIFEGCILDVHPPLYDFLVFCFTRIFGLTIFSIRFLSSLFMIISILLIYILSKKLFSNKEAIIAMLLSIANTYFLYASQYARNYSLFLMLSIVTFIFIIEIIKDIENNKSIFNKNFILYILFSSLNLYAHYYAVFLLANQLLFILLFYRKKSLKYLLFISVSILILYSPWIHLIAKRPVALYDVNYIYWVKRCVLSNNSYNFILAIFLIVPIFFIIKSLLKKETFKNVVDKYKNELILIYFAIVPYIILFFVDKYIIPCYADRHIIFFIVIHLILIARGIILVFRKFILQAVLGFILFISLIFNVLNYKIDSIKYFYCDNVGDSVKAVFQLYEYYKKYNTILLFIGNHYFDVYISKNINRYSLDDKKSKISILDFKRLSFEDTVDSRIIKLIDNKKPKYILALQADAHTTYLKDNYEVIFSEKFNDSLFSMRVLKIEK